MADRRSKTRTLSLLAATLAGAGTFAPQGAHGQQATPRAEESVSTSAAAAKPAASGARASATHAQNAPPAEESSRADPHQCLRPTASFRWGEEQDSFLTTNAEFTDEGQIELLHVTPAPSGDGQEESVILRVNSGGGRHCASGDGSDFTCKEQTFGVRLNTEKLLEHGGRVAVRLSGLQPKIYCSDSIVVPDVVVFEQHHLAVDLGTAFDVSPSGDVKPHLEVALNTNSRWFDWLAGDVDVRLRHVDSSTAQPNDKALENPSTIEGTGEAFLISPTKPWLAGVLGIGARTRPGMTTFGTDVRGRAFIGGRLQVSGYNAGQPADNFGDTRGFLQISAGYDGFWKDSSENDRNTPRRIRADGQVEIPKFGGQWVRLLVRLTFDRPFPGFYDHTDASEARISALLSIKPSLFGSLLGFGHKE